MGPRGPSGSPGKPGDDVSVSVTTLLNRKNNPASRTSDNSDTW